ncbi:nitrite reductase large subunit NirB [Magnetococcus sp. PR-3]|uniref:nitrite reductase large subunit NirB n=1 Tax=Magnetococcus sp. PR-3 TaxID=3120355 RepID=UPI002FCE6086
MNAPRKRLVVIGNGMAGTRTLEELLTLAPESYEITVFGAEPHGNYNRILLSSVLAGEKTVADIITHDRNWYEENGITLNTDNPVVSIDAAAKLVTAADGKQHGYDELLMATGSNPVMIPFPGIDLDGVVSFRDIKDVESMIEVSQSHKKAVVIGGGLLGLEAAIGLLKQGMDVTVVHLMEILMERQLDGVSAAMLKEELEGRGLKFRMGAQTEAILGQERVTGLRFKDGEEIEADLVVMAVGIRPNTDLAKQTGLETNRGVVVNDHMTTSDVSIHAVGECVEHRGMTYGLVAPLFEQGKVLAQHLAGVEEPVTYTGSTTSTRLKVTGVDLFSAGDFLGDEQTDEILFQDFNQRVYKKLVVRGDTLVGAVLLGDAMDGPWYLEMIRDGADISAMRDHILFGQAHLGDSGHGQSVASIPDSQEICGCNGITKGQVVTAILEKKLTTIDEVKLHTKASGSCGGCTGLVEKVLADTLGGDYIAPTEKSLCGCTDLTSDGVRQAVRDQKLTSIPMAMKTLDWKSEDGCPMCRQAINYYIHAHHPDEHEDAPQSRFINERVHANIQKDGTYSVIPRIWGGITAAQELRVIADIVEEFKLPEVKITGGQRITMLGVRKEDLPEVWSRLAAHNMVSGGAYGKSMRTVKTCVGSNWCRFGTQDSETMGVEIEKLIWNCWTPHKYKVAVSGCPRNCAEATIKDFGVVAVDSGWELHVGGNGGLKVRVTDLLCKVETAEEVLEYNAAYLQLYREEAKYLERTAPWVERVGVEYLKQELVENDARRQELAERFRKVQKDLPDPWKARAEGLEDYEFKPLTYITGGKEKVA